MLVTIFTAIPIWVFPLLLGLIWLGMRATKDRSTSPLLIYALPLLGLLSLSRAMGVPQAETALTALCVAYVAGAVLGYLLQPRWIVAKAQGKVSLRGEWLTFLTVMILFLGNFSAGMMQGMAPALVATTGFAVLFGAIAGLFAGLLAGRALRVALWPQRENAV